MTVTSNSEQRERAANYAARFLKLNFTVLVMEGVAFLAGMACLDATTVLPVLLARLGAAPWVIGMPRTLATLGYTLPALLAAHHIHGRTNHKSYMLATSMFGRACLLMLPISLLVFGTTKPTVAVALILFSVSVFFILDGCCAISWIDIVAKTIHVRIRGRFFGTMQTFSGLAAMGSGLIVMRVLPSKTIVFPYNYALLAGLWCLGAGLSQLGLTFVKEPEGLVDDEEKPSFIEFVRRAPILLKRHPRLIRLIAIRFVLDGAGLAAPFYVLYAQKELHVALYWVGIYGAVQSVGRISTGPVWAWISDRLGLTVGIRSIAAAIAMIPAFALLSTLGSTWPLVAVFYLMGAVQDGAWMVLSNALLESVEELERPFAIGVVTVMQTPSAIYGPLGGILVEIVSYPILFAIATAFALSGCVLSMGLGIPDKKNGCIRNGTV